MDENTLLELFNDRNNLILFVAAFVGIIIYLRSNNVQYQMILYVVVAAYLIQMGFRVKQKTMADFNDQTESYMKAFAYKPKYYYTNIDFVYFFYNNRNLRKHSRKNFDETMKLCDQFLENCVHYETAKTISREQVQHLYDLGILAVNHFHSMVFRIPYEDSKQFKSALYTLHQIIKEHINDV